jgi:hypothetical protein
MHTAKVNVTAHAAGFFVHISDPYGGSISDDELLKICGALLSLPPGCRLLLDKGYKSARTDGVEYSIQVMTPPPRERGVTQLAADKVAETSHIAGPRVVVENLLARPKNTYRVLSHPLPVAQLDLLASVIRVCCFLTNYMPPLRKGIAESANDLPAQAPASAAASSSASGPAGDDDFFDYFADED